MRKGAEITLTCTLLDEEGAGVGESDGLRVHVAGALPGERVRAQVEHVSPHRADAWATLTPRPDAPGGLETRSADRVEPLCPGFGTCGGCVLQHLAYPAQVAWKGARVRAEVERARASAQLAGVALDPCVPSPRPLGYRNRSKLVYAAAKDGHLVLGAYAPRSHEVLDLAGCRISEEPLDEVARVLLEILAQQKVAPYDERLLEGTLRYAILRVNHRGEVLATLVTASREFAQGRAVAEALLATCPAVVGVAHNLNPSRGNALFGAETVPLAGRATFEDRVGSITLRLSPTAFFQVNREVAALLYADVLAAASLTGQERVVDCYSGVGGVALTLAPHAASVIGIEDNPQAVTDAIASAELNHQTRVRFVAGDAAARLAELDAAQVIVLNPPRRGCDHAVLTAAARLRPRTLLYVSCAPDTLVRDLTRLAELGFVTRSLRPYDMLPSTPHVEVLAVLTPI